MTGDYEASQTPAPAPIEGGQIAQTVVEYTGERRGAVTYHGPSGRAYRFDASLLGKKQYVLEEDLCFFQDRPVFRVRPEQHIDPEERKLKEQQERQENQLVAAVAKLLDSRGLAIARQAPPRHAGRPRRPLADLQLLWHLRHHCLPAWSPGALATEFLDDSYATPRAAISAMLSRFKKAHPDLLEGDQCPWCAEGYAPEPPAAS